MHELARISQVRYVRHHFEGLAFDRQTRIFIVKARQKTTPKIKKQMDPIEPELSGSIAELSWIQQSLLFARLSRAAYFGQAEVEAIVSPVGFHLSMDYFDHEGAQAYRLENDTDVVITCRGTEPDEVNDLHADIDAAMVVAETVGRVHRGFKSEVDHLWPMMEKSLRSTANHSKRFWFCGHSLGGAMATISAGRCAGSDVVASPEALFTYGSPRVGTRRYVNFCKLQHYRWVNNNDIVPRLPPRWMGFRHSGEELYLNRHGQLRKLGDWAKFKDRAKGFLATLLRFRIDQLSDHLMTSYIAAIERLCDADSSRASEPQAVEVA